MQFPPECVSCMASRLVDLAQANGNEQQALAYLRECLRAIADAPEGVSSPYMNVAFEQLAQKHFGLPADRYQEEKRQSNEFMLSRAEQLRRLIAADSDPLHRALCFARTANYIDFSALRGNVQFSVLDELLLSAENDTLDAQEYANFRSELDTAHSMLILCDNAGEIVADMLLAEVLRKQYPTLELTFCVRGAPAVNDALREDAELVGVDRLAKIIDNGCAIGGTELDYIGQELRHALDCADVILAKGMGNFESMRGCGKNVYYLFLCKCTMFCHLFRVPKFTGMFLNDRRMPL